MKPPFPAGTKQVQFQTWLPYPPDEIWPFFCDPKNLERITPPWLNFQVVDSSGPLGADTTIDYKLRFRGIPMRWRTLLLEWEPGKRFVDTSLKGAFKVWHHEHRFEPVDGGTLMTDTVHYCVPLGRLGRFFSGWMVDRDVRGIFAYREKVITEIFPSNDQTGTETERSSAALSA